MRTAILKKKSLSTMMMRSQEMKEADELLELFGVDLPEASFDETRFPCTLDLRIWYAGTRLLSTHISKQYPRICLMFLGRSPIAPID
jgi:hypothetical protein